MNMAIRTIYIVLFSTILFFGCGDDQIFKQNLKDFANYQWEKGQTLTFAPKIEDTTQACNLILAFRHVHGYQFANLRLGILQKAPSGAETLKSYNVMVAEGDGYLSECSGDYCDLEAILETNFRFHEIGDYTFTLQHEMPVEKLPNVMEVGIIIEKNDVD